MGGDDGRLRTELDGFKKAYDLLLSNYGEVLKDRDAKKHRVRELEALALALADRVYRQSELLSRQAGRW